MILLLLLGLGILLYPTISNLWNEYLHHRMIGNYEAEVAQLPDETKNQLMSDAVEYNRQHTRNTVTDAFESENEYIMLKQLGFYKDKQ